MSYEKTYFTKDVQDRIEDNKFIKLSHVVSRITIIAAIIMFVITVFSIVIVVSFALNNLHAENELLIYFFFGIVVYFVVNYVLLKLEDKFRLKAYGLFRKSRIWVINYVEKKVCEAQVLSLSWETYDITDFNRMKFKCKITGNTTALLGADIFFSEESATDYLNYIERINSDALKEYYPDFEKNSDFLEYAKDYISTRFFILERSPYSSVNCYGGNFLSLVIFTTTTINGNGYQPDSTLSLGYENPLEAMLKDFLKEEKEKSERNEDKQQLISRISEYEQNRK